MKHLLKLIRNKLLLIKTIRRQSVETTPCQMEVFEKIKNYRKNNKAPVDAFGCEQLGKTNKERRFCTLVAALLSSQTRDEATANAVDKLQKGKLLSVSGLLRANIDQIEEKIKTVSFYRKKSLFLKKIAKILYTKYNQDIPPSFEEIKQLPGIGTKMALLVMQHGWLICCGISVDTHVHRISNRTGLVKTEKTKETQRELEKIFPEEIWSSINTVFVGFGQVCCKAQRPRCSVCPISLQCPKRGLSSKMECF